RAAGLALPRQSIRVEQIVERNALPVRRTHDRAGTRAHVDLRLQTEFFDGFDDTEMGDAASSTTRPDERNARRSGHGLIGPWSASRSRFRDASEVRQCARWLIGSERLIRYMRASSAAVPNG